MAARGEGAPTAPEHIGLSLDVARKSFRADAVIGLLGRMSALGFTALHLHLTETHRVAVRLPGFEDLAAPDAWDGRDVARISPRPTPRGSL